MILKGAIKLLFLIGLAQIVLAFHDLYYMREIFCSLDLNQPVFRGATIVLANVLGRLVFIPQTLFDSLHFTASSIVQFIYAHIIYIISQKIWLSVLIVCVCDKNTSSLLASPYSWSPSYHWDNSPLESF
jgi:hypothetical protein